MILSKIPMERSARLPLALLFLLLAAAAIFGGSNRGDVIVLLGVRLAAVLSIGSALALMPLHRLHSVKLPLLLLAALAIWMVLQIIPLPPGVWTALPGRERLASTAVAANIPQPWMPISIVPTKTLNSLLSLLVPLAGIVLVAWLPARYLYAQIYLVVLLGGASGVLALMQIAGSVDSLWHMYGVTRDSGAAGFFANRNHQAAFMACLLPMLATIAVHAMQSGKHAVVATTTCGTFAVFLLPLVFITGSRAGLVLLPISIFATAAILWPTLRSVKLSRRQLVAGVVALLTISGAIITVLLGSRSLALHRLATTQFFDERRMRVIEPTIQLIKQNFPIGTGFGTFDSAYRAVEPHSELYPTFLNHVHSEPFEILSDGGLPAFAGLIIFVLWWGRTSYTVWLVQRGARPAKMASVMTGLWLIASLVDYPLRTPLGALVFAMSVSWMAKATISADAPVNSVAREPRSAPAPGRREARSSTS